MNLKSITQESILDCNTISDISKKFGIKYNWRTVKKIQEHLFNNNISTEHFKTSKYLTVTKNCPICNKQFTTINDSKEKTTCSKSCANTYFRSGKNHPNWKDEGTNYRSKVELVECIRCGFNAYTKILQVHHIDRNRNNNSLSNLEVLCPNCHCIEHLKD